MVKVDSDDRIVKLEGAIWETKYVFPEDEYFVSWLTVEDRIYISSTSFAPPTEYGVLSEWKDGDMDSLFASDGNILAIEATDCFVFCVGNFTNFGNCDAENLAMFDRGTKEIIPTDRGLDGNGYAVSSSDDFVYVGGAFMYGADIYSPGIISLPSCAEGLSAQQENLSEIKIFPNPSRSASWILCSIRLTARISPLNPISPANAMFLSTGMSCNEDTRAATTAKSRAGSLILNPPAILR